MSTPRPNSSENVLVIDPLNLSDRNRAILAAMLEIFPKGQIVRPNGRYDLDIDEGNGKISKVTVKVVSPLIPYLAGPKPVWMLLREERLLSDLFNFPTTDVNVVNAIGKTFSVSHAVFINEDKLVDVAEYNNVHWLMVSKEIDPTNMTSEENWLLTQLFYQAWSKYGIEYFDKGRNQFTYVDESGKRTIINLQLKYPIALFIPNRRPFNGNNENASPLGFRYIVVNKSTSFAQDVQRDRELKEGVGGMASVYPALGTLVPQPNGTLQFKTEPDRIVKIVDHHAASAEMVDNEAAIGALTHVNSKHAIHLNEWGKSVFVQTKLPGNDLFDICDIDRTKEYLLSTDVILALMLNMAEAYIQQVQEKGFVHKDLKLENIRVELASLVVNIFDFGLAKRTPTVAEEERAGSHTTISPEVLLQQPATHLSDAYAFGVIFAYLMRVENEPFTNKNGKPFNTDELIDYLRTRNFANMFAGMGDLDPAHQARLQELVRKLIQFNPEERLSVAQAIEVLQQIILERRLTALQNSLPVIREANQRLAVFRTEQPRRSAIVVFGEMKHLLVEMLKQVNDDFNVLGHFIGSVPGIKNVLTGSQTKLQIEEKLQVLEHNLNQLVSEVDEVLYHMKRLKEDLRQKFGSAQLTSGQVLLVKELNELIGKLEDVVKKQFEHNTSLDDIEILTQKLDKHNQACRAKAQEISEAVSTIFATPKKSPKKEKDASASPSKAGMYSASSASSTATVPPRPVSASPTKAQPGATSSPLKRSSRMLNMDDAPANDQDVPAAGTGSPSASPAKRKKTKEAEGENKSPSPK